MALRSIDITDSVILNQDDSPAWNTGFREEILVSDLDAKMASHSSANDADILQSAVD